MATSNPFDNIGFEDFRRLASDKSLSKYERIGFPDSYRKGFEAVIFKDILAKLTNLNSAKKRVLDIGPGCSDLPLMLVKLCRKKKHALTLVDSREMLSHLPGGLGIGKVEALFPNCSELLAEMAGKADVILCYSVLHYVFVDTALYRFLDSALSLLAPGGQMLIGDIPNVSKRKRFFASGTGIRFHQKFMKTKGLPKVEYNQVEADKIDDSVVFALLQRARAAGFDAYVLPQDPALPMANRREDIFITRP